MSMLWTVNTEHGIKILSHQWFWLLLPLLVRTLQTEQNRTILTAAISTGLALHLEYTVLQSLGYVHVTVAGSFTYAATGHIGHTAFGLVYGLWAGWLIHIGIQSRGWKCWIPFTLALWALMMIFAAHGRGGYMVAATILIILTWKDLIIGYDWKRFILATILLASTLVIFASGPAQDRIQQTWQEVDAIKQGQISASDPRWAIWLGSIEAWKLHPMLGTGTGSFTDVTDAIARSHPELVYEGGSFAHPHNMYLLAMVRMGSIGLLLLIGFLASWIYIGWRADWKKSSAGCLITLSGISIAVHGFTSSSIEEHFSAIISIAFLAAGLALMQQQNIEPDDS